MNTFKIVGKTLGVTATVFGAFWVIGKVDIERQKAEDRMMTVIRKNRALHRALTTSLTYLTPEQKVEVMKDLSETYQFEQVIKDFTKK